MKYLVTILTVLILTGLTFSQDQPVSETSSKGFAEYKVHKDYAPSWDDFDKNSGKMQFNAGSNFVGTTIAYMHKGNSRFLYGFNVDILSFSSPAINNLFATPFSQSSLVGRALRNRKTLRQANL